MDGADQSAFGLPHFVSSTKNEKGHSLKVRLIGLLDQEKPNRLCIYMMTEEHETGANRVIEAIQRFINQRDKSPLLPDTLLVQFDSCTRKNTSR